MSKIILLETKNVVGRTCYVSVALQLVPHDVDGGDEEEEAADNLYGVADEQRVLHAVVVDGEVAARLVKVDVDNLTEGGVYDRGVVLAHSLGGQDSLQAVRNLRKINSLNFGYAIR
jgi:hypothetical protein